MNNVNRVNLNGNIIKEPEYTRTNDRQGRTYPIMRYTIAINERIANGRDKAHYINCIQQNPKDYIVRNLHAKCPVVIEGKLTTTRKEIEGILVGVMEVKVETIFIYNTPPRQKRENRNKENATSTNDTQNNNTQNNTENNTQNKIQNSK